LMLHCDEADATALDTLSLHDALPICKPRINNLEKFSEEVGDTRYTVNGFTFGGLATQVAFAAAEATTGEKTGAAANVDYVMTLRSEEHTSELQSRFDLVCRLLLEKKK